MRFLNGCFAAFMLLLITVWGEVVVFSILPGFSHSALNPLRELFSGGPAITAPTGLDWLAAACPLAIAIVAVLIPVILPRSESIRQIMADDAGITVQKGNRPEHIPWDDISLFVRTSSDAIALPFGSYVLWGRSHRVEFSIETPEVAAMRRSSSALSQGRPFFLFEGGYETYLENSRRLLATIATRSSVSLLAMREMSLAIWLRRRMPVLTISEEAAKALPDASQKYQPHVDDATATLRFGEQLTLKVRLALLPFLGELLALFAGVAGIGFLGAGSRFVQGLQQIITYPDVATYPAIAFYISFIALFLIIIFPVGVTIILAWRRSAFPPVFADGFGISGKSRLQGQLVTIPWQSITAWVVIPPPVGSNKPVRYIIFGDGHKLTWAEPADARLAGRGIRGDRREAYRALATRVHALIAARTGLPLRELRTDALPVGQV